jgi:glutathione synthase/RimK-type ligase-like ATP-grasp enzyme
MTVHILFENEAWLPPLTTALQARGLAFETHFVDGGTIDLGEVPPEGVFVNRMSPSAHTRGHQGGVQYLKELLVWLEAHGRPVINGSAAFDLEVSKVRQDITLRAAGIDTPRTIAVVGRERLSEAARAMALPFITKHNQGGKGLGVKLFRDLAAFDAYVASDEFVESPDGTTLLQQYIEPPVPFITRVEIVDGEFLYAIKSSTVDGFELCPAVTCAPDAAFCPVGGTGKFSRREDLTAQDPLVQAYVRYAATHGLDVAGIEFVEDRDGRRYTYDVNANSNYNATVEGEHGFDGMAAIAALCSRRLAEALAAKCVTAGPRSRTGSRSRSRGRSRARTGSTPCRCPRPGT